MFDLSYEPRMESWRTFREEIETVDDPYQSVIDLYKTAPTVSIHTDPWDNSTWPSPWELIYENQYCPFCRVLGQCYSLQLTERFKDSAFEIHIGIDKKKSETLYMLAIDDIYIVDEQVINKSKIDTSVTIQKKYNMTANH